jgi:hypothetical protein
MAPDPIRAGLLSAASVIATYVRHAPATRISADARIFSVTPPAEAPLPNSHPNGPDGGLMIQALTTEAATATAKKSASDAGPGNRQTSS